MFWHSNFTKFSICEGSLWVLNISLEIHKVRKHKGSKTACHIVSTKKKKKRTKEDFFFFNNPLHLKTYEKPLRPVVWMKANRMVYVLPSVKSSLQEQVRGEINLKLYGSMDALVHALLQQSWHLASCPAVAALQGTLSSQMHPTQLHIPKKFPISEGLSVMTLHHPGAVQFCTCFNKKVLGEFVTFSTTFKDVYSVQDFFFFLFPVHIQKYNCHWQGFYLEPDD